jgi:hypothetical protein
MAGGPPSDATLASGFDPAAHVRPVPEEPHPREGHYRPAFAVGPDAPEGAYLVTLHELDEDGAPVVDRKAPPPPALVVYHDPAGKYDESGNPLPELVESEPLAPPGPTFVFHPPPGGGGVTFRRQD